MNVLVGPNNSGKSTVLGALRALRVAMKRATRFNAEPLCGPKGQVFGWSIPEASLPISLENVHTDYEDAESEVDFRFSNGNHLTLHFPRDGGCFLFTVTTGCEVRTTSRFKAAFPVEIATVPVLGPVEHEEPLVKQETVQRELDSHRASRHFRNYWHFFPDGFDRFAELVRTTWPGMAVLPPEKPDLLSRTLHMFCREDRVDRELYWAGFGFQVWCQMLTHVSRAASCDLLIVDEPEIYLHPEVQRRLLGILREAGPDVLLATHSSEIMSEADPSEIMLIDKTKRAAQRLHDIASVQNALDAVGSVQNITLTQLARNRRVLFVEDDHDFDIIRRYAQVYGLKELAVALGVTPVRSEGFASWQRISAMSWGIERTLGCPLLIGVVYDRDFFPQGQLDDVREKLTAAHVSLVHFHMRKEIENYLLEPVPLQRALESAVRERTRNGAPPPDSTVSIREILTCAEEETKTMVISQLAARRADYLKGSGVDPATVTQEVLEEIGGKWANPDARRQLIPGKEVLRAVRKAVQEKFKVNLTDFRILNAFHRDEIPPDMVELLNAIECFRTSDVPSES